MGEAGCPWLVEEACRVSLQSHLPQENSVSYNGGGDPRGGRFITGLCIHECINSEGVFYLNGEFNNGPLRAALAAQSHNAAVVQLL